jgi:hypothetical protein
MSDFKEKKQSKKAASPPAKKDKSHLNCFCSPGLSQSQVLARIANLEGFENFEAIRDAIIERVQDGNNQDIETILHAQITMLNSLGSHFMIKSLGGYSSPEVLKSLPQLPLEFANLSLKCQTEMRRCIELLHDLKSPKKPSQFIKTYVNQQLNSLQIEQQELRERLEATNYAQMDTRSTPEAKRDDQELETMGELHGTTNGRGQGN